MRGLDSIDTVVSSGLGHLTSFLGTDSLPAIWGARHYYGETGFIAGSVPATEHSVMSANITTIYNELESTGEYKGYKISEYGD
jgi:nicotinamide phosphoribosyltransferase